LKTREKADQNGLGTSSGKRASNGKTTARQKRRSPQGIGKGRRNCT